MNKPVHSSIVTHQSSFAALLKRYLPDTEVWAYGSRVKFTSKPSSDLDLVAFASSDQKMAVRDLEEAFEESDLPFRVDFFIWDEVPEQFHKNIETDRVVLPKHAEKQVVESEWEKVLLKDVCSKMEESSTLDEVIWKNLDRLGYGE